MKRTTARLFVLAALVVGCSPKPATPSTTPPVADAPPPAADALPAAEEILAQSVEAAGGKDAHEKLASYYSESHMEIPSQGLSADTKTWWEKGKFYSEITMPGVGLTRVWFDGTTVTSDDPVNGRRTLDGKESIQTRWASSVSLAHDWKNYFTQASTVGRREVDGRKLLDVKLTGEQESEVVLSFDESTHLLASQQFKQQSPMGAMPVEIAVVEYKPYAGIQHAARTEMRLAIFTATTTVTKFDANVEIDDAKFTPTAPEPPKPAPAAAPADAKKKPKAKAKADAPK
jgi:hypothetical protein